MRVRFFRNFVPVFANDNDALIPELWAQEALMVLDQNLMAANLVYRDFEDKVARFGDVVNAHRPAKFIMKRKIDGDSVVAQDATSSNIPVKLDQHVYATFVIYDGEETKSFKSLRDMYLERAIMAIAQGIDRIVLFQVYEFLTNLVGKIGTALTGQSLIDVREKMNNLLVPMDGRNLIVTPNAEGDLLAVDKLLTANTVGDEGSALRAGSIGTKYGINVFMSQNAPSISSGLATVTPDVDGAHSAGDTTITVDGGVTVVAGSWCLIDGDNIPQKITAVNADPATQLTISPGLSSDVANDAVVTVVTPAAINLGAGYDLGYTKPLTINGIASAPATGQLASIGAAAAKKNYGLLDTPTATEIIMNRALDAAAVNTEVVGLGPDGQYSFAFHRNALALVIRPLAIPMEGAGARAAVVNANGLSMRVTIAYDSEVQGHRVTCDALCGIKTLDTNLGVPLIS